MKVFLVNFLLIKLTFLINISKACEKVDESFTFSDEFRFGAASAAYQIEGGWNEDGKTPSIWDTFTHNHQEMIADKSDGDVSADSYHFYKSDIEALKQIGVIIVTVNRTLVNELSFYSFITIDFQYHGQEFL